MLLLYLLLVNFCFVFDFVSAASSPSSFSTITSFSNAPQTIASLANFTVLRSCARGCFWYTEGGRTASSDGIADHIDCDTAGPGIGAFDACWCSTDLQPGALQYLSTCIKSSCEGDTGVYKADLSRGLALYGSYCQGKGYTTATTTEASLEASPTSSESSKSSEAATATSNTQTTQTTNTNAAPSIPTDPSASSTSTSNNLSRADIIQISVGVLAAVIAIVIGVWQGRKGSATRRRLRKWGEGQQRGGDSDRRGDGPTTEGRYQD